MSDVIQFPRTSVRPASNRPRVLPFSIGNYEAGLSSGMSPVAAPGGSRLPVAARTSGSSQPPHSHGLEVHFAATAATMFLAGCLTVALLTLVLL